LNFDDLVQKYGGDVFSFNNPDGYYVTRGIYHQAFEDAAFSLSNGEISGIVRTDAGWSILRRYEKEAAYLADHFEELVKDYRNGQFNRKVEEAAAGLTVTPTERLADYTIFNLDTTY
ncbi:MAG: peptidylprolyl isomerase, partial [Clostridia bacterium]|nr:peptidylprolyl isomerase [Clostridia bacterium]